MARVKGGLRVVIRPVYTDLRTPGQNVTHRRGEFRGQIAQA